MTITNGSFPLLSRLSNWRCSTQFSACSVCRLPIFHFSTMVRDVSSGDYFCIFIRIEGSLHSRCRRATPWQVLFPHQTSSLPEPLDCLAIYGLHCDSQRYGNTRQ